MTDQITKKYQMNSTVDCDSSFLPQYSAACMSVRYIPRMKK